MELKRNLGLTVRQRRLELGLSQVQLAERMGTNSQQADVSRIERGFLPWPRPELLQLLAHALEMPVLELITRSGWMAPEELEHYRSQTAAPAHTPLVVIGRRQYRDEELSPDLFSPNRFRFITIFDGVTLIDTIRATAPDLILVHQALPALDLGQLADALGELRLATDVIVIGHRDAVPSTFRLVEAPATPAAIRSVLVALGYG
jgi:transcriptional regulator with XRE-family HTH domain